jgi:16S rRNA (cytosine967-C5)-methyltransferase
LVFCDVPCSGSGAWRRDPEGKWSLTQKKYENLLLMQEDILVTAANLIKPGGYLVYATCSVLIDENESQVRKFLKNFSEWTIEEENSLIPNSLGDGFYFSILKKLAKN